MTVETRLEFDKLPGVAPAYLRTLTNVGGGLEEGATIPDIEAEVAAVVVDRRKLAAYREVCGFAQRDSLPVTYPHILAFPLHMTVLTHRSFPLKLLGLVHIRNAITQHRAIGLDERLSLNVYVSGHREVPNGLEFDLATRFCDGSGNTVWESNSTMLSRGPGGGKRGKKRDDEETFELDGYATWDAPIDIGRRYARAAGDFNPIHLSALSAKLFGFPRAIAHGMWSKARTAAQIEDQLEQEAYRLQVAFKKPVLLPSSVMLKYHPDDRGIGFVLMDPNGEIVHMQGAATYL
jgi:hypothetical protein